MVTTALNHIYWAKVDRDGNATPVKLVIPEIFVLKRLIYVQVYVATGPWGFHNELLRGAQKESVICRILSPTIYVYLVVHPKKKDEWKVNLENNTLAQTTWILKVTLSV